MENQENQGSLQTFYGMISKYCIRIPSLQRSYAQGRDTSEAKEIRNPFIADLKDALTGGASVTLDNIYGQVDESLKMYIPLDGQQRLTTLFLLHTYLLRYASDSEEVLEMRKILCNTEQLRFCYATRKTSEDFCSYLLDKDFCVWQKGSTIQQLIKNDMEYQWNWNFDPTIASMLNMLDTIHEIFSKGHEDKEEYADFCRDCCKKLAADSAECPITFYEQNIKNTLPDDELYIRMNARGLALTSFENFKASLLNYLKGCEIKEISRKIDTDWINALWLFVKNNDNAHNDSIAEVVDTYVLKMLQIAIMCYLFEQDFSNVSAQKDKPVNIKDLYEYFSVKPESLKAFSFYELQQRGGLSPDWTADQRKELAARIDYIFEKLMKALKEDGQLSKNELLRNRLQANAEGIKTEDKGNIWSYARTLHFYAEHFYEYYMKASPSSEWKNIMTRLIEFSDIREAADFYNAHRTIFSLLTTMQTQQKEIGELIRECDAGEFKKLFTSDGKISGFNNTQIFEEGLKVLLRRADQNWNEVIEETERSSFFGGQFLFLFECLLEDNTIQSTDIYNCENLLLQNKEEKLRLFKRHRDDILEIFAGNNDLRFLLRKALLVTDLAKTTQDKIYPDYPFTPEYIKDYKSSPDLYHTNKSGFIHQTPNHSEWKRILRLDVNKSAQDKTEYRALIRETVRAIACNEGTLEERLKAYIQDMRIEPFNDVTAALTRFAQIEWKPYYTYLGGARMINKNGQIALLKGMGQRMDKDYMELHIILLSDQWDIRNLTKISDMGMLVIKHNDTEYKFKYDSGCIKTEDEEWSCAYDMGDLKAVREAIIQYINDHDQRNGAV